MSYFKLDPEKVVEIWNTKSLETKRQLALKLIEGCRYKNTLPYIEIRNRIATTKNGTVIDFKIKDLMFVGERMKVDAGRW